MQIAGIDTYYRTTDQQLGHHIDFISKDCLEGTIYWSKTGKSNNGDNTSDYPYMISNIKDYLTNTVYPKLPQEVRNVIKQRRSLLEKRYSMVETLIDSTSWGWENVGNLWIPTEYEVGGAVIWGTPGWSAGQTVQYSLFANSHFHSLKMGGNNGARQGWWLSSVRSGTALSSCGVSSQGMCDHGSNTDALRGIPLCFRILA